MPTKRFLVVLVAFLGLPLGLLAQQTPVELGRVAWRRNYDKARAEAKKLRRPILLLFQEVPG